MAHDPHQAAGDLREDALALLGDGRLVLGDGVEECDLVLAQRRREMRASVARRVSIHGAG